MLALPDLYPINGEEIDAVDDRLVPGIEHIRAKKAFIRRFPNLKLVKSRNGHEYLELTKSCASLDPGVELVHTRSMKDIDERFPDFPQSIYRAKPA